MWAKENDHAPKSECAFFNICPTKAFLRRKKFKKKTIILLSSPGLYLSSLIVRCVEDVACKSSHNNFYKNK